MTRFFLIIFLLFFFKEENVSVSHFPLKTYMDIP